MADSTVRIANLDASEARVAYDVYYRLRDMLEGDARGNQRVQRELDLLTQCRIAANGYKADVSKIR